MSGVIDRIGARDVVDADLSREHKQPKQPCPKCGSESKEHHTRGMRVCSSKNCREVFGTPEPISTEATAPVVVSEPVGAVFPCPKCKHETKEDHEPGSRICSNRGCRHKILAPS